MLESSFLEDWDEIGTKMAKKGHLLPKSCINSELVSIQRVNMFLFKSLAQGLFRSEEANSNKLTSGCYHAVGLVSETQVKFPPGPRKTKQSKNKR